MFWKKSTQASKSVTAVKTVEDTNECFSRTRLSTVTFTIDQLPVLKKARDAYQKESQQRYERQQRKEFLRPLARDLAYLIQRVTGAYTASNEEKVLHLLIAHAGEILDGLEKARAQGWDGKSFWVDDTRDFPYQADRSQRLTAIINGLEAGQKQVTLEIPEAFASEYEFWLLDYIAHTAIDATGVPHE